MPEPVEQTGEPQDAQPEPTPAVHEQTFTQRWEAFFRLPAPNLVIRTICLLLGYMFIALGVAVSRSTGLGVSPISSIPNVLSYITALTVGQWTLIVNALFVLLQFCLLRKNFQPVQLLQLLATVIFSAMIDFFVPLAELIPQPGYPAHLLVICVSTFITALGVFLEVRASLVPLPGEGISVTISQVTDIPFHRCKVGTDTTNVLVGAIISLVSVQALVGVREGTIIVAVCTGFIVKLYGNLAPNFHRIVPTAGMLDISARKR